MQLEAKILTSTLMQQIPSILVKASSSQYLFNPSENLERFSRRYGLNPKMGPHILCTDYGAETMGALASYLVTLYGRNKSFGARVYLSGRAYDYGLYLKQLMGYRLLNYCLYDMEGGRQIYGVRDWSQAEALIHHNKHKFIRGAFDNEELQGLLDQAVRVDAGKDDGFTWVSNEQMKIYYFMTNLSSEQHAPIFNYICIPQQQKGRVDKTKLSFLCKLYGVTQVQMQKHLFTHGHYRVDESTVIREEDVREEETCRPVLMIIHYRSQHNMAEIRNSQALGKIMSQLQYQGHKINTVIHVVEGDAQLLLTPEFHLLSRHFGAGVRNLVYHKQLHYYESSEELKHELMSIYPHFELSYKLRAAGVRHVADLVGNAIRAYQMGFFLSNLQYRQLETEGVNVATNSKCLVLAPARKQGYNLYSLATHETEAIRLPVLQATPRLPADDQVRQALSDTLKHVTNQFDPVVIFLGTASKVSTYFRNVSGILLKMPGGRHDQLSMVLDCGEGIYNQMSEHFGPHLLEPQLLKLRVLFVSHMHVDHVSGIFLLLSKRNKILTRQMPGLGDQERMRYIEKNLLFLVVPQNAIPWFDTYCQKVERLDMFCRVISTQSLCDSQLLKLSNQYAKNNRNYSKSKIQNSFKPFKTDTHDEEKIIAFLRKDQGKCDQIDSILGQQQTQGETIRGEEKNTQPLSVLVDEKSNEAIQKFKNVLGEVGIVQVTPIPMIHCPQSFGIVVRHRSGVKISFSGDCIPSETFKKYAHNSTLMIHEATFNERQQRQAAMSKHSTEYEAQAMGYNSDSLMTALTHISSQAENQFFIKSVSKQWGKIAEIGPRVVPAMKKQLPRGLGLELQSFAAYQKHHTFRCFDHLVFRLSEMAELPALAQKLSKFQS